MMIELAANERAVHGDFFNSKCLLREVGGGGGGVERDGDDALRELGIKAPNGD